MDGLDIKVGTSAIASMIQAPDSSGQERVPENKTARFE
jgi:hypothetical protein